MLHGRSFKRTGAAGIAREGHDLLHKGRFVLCQARFPLNMVASRLVILNEAPNGLLLIACVNRTVLTL